MATKRHRVARFSTLSAEATAWLGSADAEDFFAAPNAYLKRHPNACASPIQRLPGVCPWWPPLAMVWAAHLAASPIPHRGPGHARLDSDALAFLLALKGALVDSHETDLAG
jgi:hypothetical protein